MTFKLLVSAFTILWLFAIAFLIYLVIKVWVSEINEKNQKDE
jgi:threonine/homoserine/homoserine lactone efflux protein